MAAPFRTPLATPEEYLAAERRATDRHEYVDGTIYAMSGASFPHMHISTSIAISLGSQLKGGPCAVVFHDLKVRSADMRTWFYPDLAVICGDPLFHDDEKDVVLNPTVVIEVLSPSTEAYDRNFKFERYREIDSLTDYLLVSQNRPLVEHFHRLGESGWRFVAVTGLEGVVEIATLNARLALADVYERVAFPEPTVPHPVVPESREPDHNP